MFQLGESLATLAAWAWETQSETKFTLRCQGFCVWCVLERRVWNYFAGCVRRLKYCGWENGKLVVLCLEDVSGFAFTWWHDRPCGVKVKDDDARLLEVPVHLNKKVVKGSVRCCHNFCDAHVIWRFLGLSELRLVATNLCMSLKWIYQSPDLNSARWEVVAASGRRLTGSTWKGWPRGTSMSSRKAEG